MRRRLTISRVILILALCTLTFVILPMAIFFSVLNGTGPKQFDDLYPLGPQFLYSDSDYDSDSTSTSDLNSESLENVYSNEDESVNQEKQKSEIVVATVACGKSEYLPTLLKSSLLFTLDEQTSLHFIIFTDPENLNNLNTTMNAFVNESKSNGYARNFSYKLQPVWFPSSEKTGINWREMYANCSTQRLFFPSILPEVDSLIYLDADTIILGNLTQVWNEFSLMNSEQMIALGPDNMWTYDSKTKIPYVGQIGVNAGVILMNLTILRQFEFEKKVNEQYQIYKNFIDFADQDLINIIFHNHPKNIKLLTCSFNFMWSRCYAGQPCADIRDEGVLILHGAKTSFKPQDAFPDSIFPLIYETMNNFSLSESPITLLEKIKFEWYSQDLYCSSATPEILVQNARTYFKNLKEQILSKQIP